MRSPLRVGIVGYGLIGRRRAEIVASDERVLLAGIADPSPVARAAAEQRFGVPAGADTDELLSRAEIVIVATPNALAVPVVVAALQRGCHVLVEKPPGASAADCRAMARAARQARRILKIGFNHRYHPAIARLIAGVRAGDIGEVINVRARYGHGGRQGYESEWRGNAALSGGGELLDQGVHLLDLLHAVLGLPESVHGALQTAVWPVAPLEDNGFALLRYTGGAIASLHSSWTQWKNLFSLEVFGTQGALLAEGLGGSYGVERSIWYRRRPEGGVPEMVEEAFSGPDESWSLEWREFMGAILSGLAYQGTPAEGLAVMTVLEAIYRSARSGRTVRLTRARLRASQPQ